nr:ATP-binding protein [Pedococcus badiiscoriae]
MFFDAAQHFDPQRVAELEALAARLGDELREVQRATTHADRSLEAEPVPPSAQAVTYSVAADPRAVGAARHFAVSALAAWGVDEGTVTNAILCLSELVTNAVMHTDAGCELRFVLHHGVLTGTVRDSGSNVVVDPGNVAVDPLAVHGRGLQLVDALATRWGSRLDAGGMTVWFVLEPAA